MSIKTIKNDNDLCKKLDLEVGNFLRAHYHDTPKYSNALRHIYVSAVFTQMRGEQVTHIYGVLNEIFGFGSGISDMQIDLHNNEIGRMYGLKYPAADRKMLLEIIFNDMVNGKVDFL